MALSEEQIKNIDVAYDISNAALETSKKGMKDGRDRIKRLADAGFHIERFMVNGQLVEHAIKNVLHACKLKREIYEILALPDPYGNVAKDERGQKMFEEQFGRFAKLPMGVLIGLIRKTTGENELSDTLETFNTFRQDFIHQAFNGSRELEEMDRQAEEYFTTRDDFPVTVIPLGFLHQKIQKEIADLIKSVRSAEVEPIG